MEKRQQVEEFAAEMAETDISFALVRMDRNGTVTFTVNGDLIHTQFMVTCMQNHVYECLSGRDPSKKGGPIGCVKKE